MFSNPMAVLFANFGPDLDAADLGGYSDRTRAPLCSARSAALGARRSQARLNELARTVERVIPAGGVGSGKWHRQRDGSSEAAEAAASAATAIEWLRSVSAGFAAFHEPYGPSGRL